VLSGNNLGVFTVEDEPPAKRIGRPSSYTSERADAICQELAKGRSVNSILKAEGMPCRMALVNWLAANPEFAAKYAHARDIGYDVFAENLLLRAANVAPELVQSVRLEVDTARWYLGKVCRRYNDKVEARMEVSGLGGAPIALDIGGLLHTTLLTESNLSKLTDEELAHWEAAIASIPKMLAAPPTIEGAVTEIEETNE
jgi:hypothetical protein